MFYGCRFLNIAVLRVLGYLYVWLKNKLRDLLHIKNRSREKNLTLKSFKIKKKIKRFVALLYLQNNLKVTSSVDCIWAAVRILCVVGTKIVITAALTFHKKLSTNQLT